jgi:large repetitive protein
MGGTNYFLAHDAIGNSLAIQDARSNVWHFGYDPLGRLTSVTDPLTNVTTYAYDGANNRTNVVNALLKSFGLEYDDHNNLVRAVDPLSKVRSYQYNTDDLRTRETDAEGKELATIYDNEGRVLRTVDGATNQIVYRYDETRATPASSYLPVRIEYPSFSRNLYYDTMQRVVREEDVLGGGTNYSRSYTYDLAGNVLSATDAENHTNRFEYDALNRLVKTTDPAGGITRRTYDDRSNLIAVEDPNGGITRYQFDRNNRLKRMTRPMGQETRYEYDAVGNCTAVIDAKGQKIANEYDAVNRLVRRLEFAATDHTNAVKTVSFTYNALGNLTAWNDGTNAATFTYDDLQRKSSESVSYGAFALSYSNAYYANGLKKSFTGPDAITYGYVYDANNRLTALSVPGVGVVTLEGFSWNRPTRTTLPGGSRTEFAYDSLMRFKSIIAREPTNTVVMSRDYGYSPVGNVISKATEHGTYIYGYDNLYRLTSATNPASANEAYAYDPLSNRTNSTAVSGPWTYNQNNELLGYTNVSFAYDTNGNLIHKTEGPQTVNYFYDVANCLIRVEDGTGSVIAEYGYDPFGRRLWKKVGAIRTYFFYSDEGLVGEYTADGAEIKTYGYAPGSPWSSAPVYQKTGGNYYWYHNDHLGTPQKIVDSSGHVVWSGTYDSFGHCAVAVAEIGNNLRFAGQYYDAELGLHYNWNRYYDPSTGRYLSTDPILQGQNLYAYVSGNPIIFIDPEGLCVLRIAGGLAEAILGFAAVPATWGVSALVGLHGLDSAWAGVQSLVQWRPVDSYTSQGLQRLGLPQWAANLVDAGLSLLGSSAAGQVLQASLAAQGTETFYRTMSQANYDHLLATGKIPATSETFISPSLEYASQYNGVTVQFGVRAGTTDSLLSMGVRNAGLTGGAYGSLPLVQRGWGSGNAFFKLEGGVVNIGLGSGAALDTFNGNIVNFNLIPKP